MISAISRRLLLAATAALAFVAVAQAGDINGAGASFPYPIYSKWAEDYKKSTGIGLNYTPNGSGFGIAQIKAKTVAFGASDQPQKPADLKESGLVQFPAIIGGVVPVVNVPGLKAGDLTLDGPTLANIYLGKVTKWNDAAIKKLNPSAKLPSTDIAPVFRSDSSGTNFLFTSYLAAVSPDFQTKLGAGTKVEFTVGVGAAKNDGVANQTKQTEGAIGYVEYAYAKQNNLTWVKLVNAAGKAVVPNLESFSAAASNADWKKAENYFLVLTNQPGAGSWPITGASFILVHAVPENPAETTQALKFFSWAFKNGAASAKELDFVPLPDSLVKQIQETWKGIKGVTL
jgi:phosphate transport system substrate-binding protein